MQAIDTTAMFGYFREEIGQHRYYVYVLFRWLYRETHTQRGTVEYCRPFGSTAPQMRVLNDRTGNLVWVGLFEKPKNADRMGTNPRAAGSHGGER